MGQRRGSNGNLLPAGSVRNILREALTNERRILVVGDDPCSDLEGRWAEVLAYLVASGQKRYDLAAQLEGITARCVRKAARDAGSTSRAPW